jgi:ferric-dicitrate binding protein FerR (iron transport regulator)
MKDEGFPWTQFGPGPEPRLPTDFASRVIAQAQTTRARGRRAKIELGAAAGLAAMIAIFLSTRPTMPTQRQASQVAATSSIANLDTISLNTESNDVATTLMPNARQVENFDSYYETSTWDTYASWDSDSYEASRIR